MGGPCIEASNHANGHGGLQIMFGVLLNWLGQHKIAAL